VICECCVLTAELSAAWVISSSSSSEEDVQQSDTGGVDRDSSPQTGRSKAYTATRTFYRNRPDQQEPSANTAVNSDRLQDTARTADHLLNNKQQTRNHTFKNNDYLNYNKSAKFKNDRSVGGKNADMIDRRDNCNQRSNLDRGNVSRQATNCEHKANSRENESLKDGRREDDSADNERASGDIRYSRNRRMPKKWQRLPILPAAATHNRPPTDHTATDERRPYRRNLPPRMLAKLKQQTSGAADGCQTATDGLGCSHDAGKTPHVETDTRTTPDVANASADRQNQGELTWAS